MKIGFYGATGSWDFGDYAMMVHNIQEIWKLADDSEFYVFTPDKYITLQVLVDNLIDIKKINKIHVVNEPRFLMSKIAKVADRVSFRLFKYHFIYAEEYEAFCKGDDISLPDDFKETINNIDILLFNGGGYLQHSWNISNFIFATAIKYARSCGKPVFFLGNSIGPMKSYDSVIRGIVHDISRIMIRDGNNYTKKLLDKYGYNNYINGPDDLTFVNDVYQCESQYQNYVIVEVMMWIDCAKRGRQYILEELLKLIDYINDSGKKVVLVSFDHTDTLATECINYLHYHACHKESIFKIINIASMYEMFGLYRYCDFSISFKYHPVILALGSNKPFIGIICDNDGYYEGKLKGACENLEVSPEKHIIHIDSIRDGSLINMYKNNVGRSVVSNVTLKRLKCIRRKYLQEILLLEIINVRK